MGALRKTMLYLGLADDQEQYEDYPEDLTIEQEALMSTPERHADVTPIRREFARPAAQPAAPTDLRRITTIHPRSYNDARQIGDAFRGGVPVIMNLTDMEDAEAKRMVDFSAGLIFGLHGSIERVTKKVFLLSPEHVEVTGEDTDRQAGRVFDHP